MSIPARMNAMNKTGDLYLACATVAPLFPRSDMDGALRSKT